MDINGPEDCTNLFAFQRQIMSHKKGFLSYNTDRIKEIIRYFSNRALDLFYAVPFLLHVNSPRFPGYVAGRSVPHGIYRFHQSDMLETAKRYFKVSRQTARQILPKSCSIQSLYLMGSLGTIGQTGCSDLDYWICVDDAGMTSNDLSLLRQKTILIEEWGRDNFGQDIHFFVMETNKVRSNDFGEVTEESSGSAQKSILKEEFYRTFIYIAGKIPFWAVFAPGLTNEEYLSSIVMAGRMTNVNFFFDDYIDLGNLCAIDRKEFLGAALWQCYKAGSDPIKAIIKVSLLAEQFFANEEGIPLCDEIKKGFQQYSFEQKNIIDPYLPAFDHAIKLYENLEDEAGLDLIRRCIILRMTGVTPARSRLTEGPKKNLIEKYENLWKWDTETIESMRSYKDRSEAKKLAFEEEIMTKIWFLFELLQKGVRNERLPVFDMTREDQKALTNKIRACFQRRPGKIPRCSTYLKRIAAESGYVISRQSKDGEDMWLLSRGSLSYKKSDRGILYSSKHLIPLVGWLVVNELCVDISAVYFWSYQGGITQIKGQKLTKELHGFFAGNTPTSQNRFLSLQNARVFVAINTEVSSGQWPVHHADYLVQNTWDEIFHYHVDLAGVENEVKKCYRIATDIRSFLPDSGKQEKPCKIYSIWKRLESEVTALVSGFLGDPSLGKKPPSGPIEKKTGAVRGKDQKGVLLDTF